MDNNFGESNSLEVILVNAVKIPGVKVDRREFLLKTFDKYASENSIDISEILEKGPVNVGISVNNLDKIATNLISKRTLQSSGASFAAGLPGGIAMAATIPADTLQFFGVALRLAQELAYVYGYNDMWSEGEVISEKIKGELTLFLGVMFGIGGSASALKLLSANISKQILKQLPNKALTKTIYYPIIKKIAKSIGINMTKKTFANSISKAIPIVGGVISGGLTYTSMKPMGVRLRDALSESINYNEENIENDLKNVSEVIDIDFEELKEENTEELLEENIEVKSAVSIADELLKYKQLLDMGAINQEEFENLKKKLIDSM